MTVQRGRKGRTNETGEEPKKAVWGRHSETETRSPQDRPETQGRSNVNPDVEGIDFAIDMSLPEEPEDGERR